MTEKCDFYRMDHDGSLEWIGSLKENGSPYYLPIDLFLVSDYITFEENLLDYLKEKNGHIRFDGNSWPWEWNSSEKTDYTYIFHECSGTVLMCDMGSRLVDVIEILRGVDMIGADVGIGKINFPIMGKNKKKEIKNINGSKSPEIV